MVNIVVQRNGARIYLNIQEELPIKTLWIALVLPYGCEANIVASHIELSKYVT